MCSGSPLCEDEEDDGAIDDADVVVDEVDVVAVDDHEDEEECVVTASLRT